MEYPERRRRPRSNDRYAQRTLVLLTIVLLLVAFVA